MIRARRPLRQHPDIWPGFVDALSTLLMVIIFVLVVFVLAQFFLNQLLQGKDTQLQNLEQAIASSPRTDPNRRPAQLPVGTQLSSDCSLLAEREDTAALLAGPGRADQFAISCPARGRQAL
jgi:chemotaxis protein MotB